MKNRVTIKDISKEAGVSATTVTKALHGRDKISEETRRRILDIAEKRGYTPNRFASALARNNIHLGIVIPDGPKEFMQYVEDGIHQGIEELIDERVIGHFLKLPWQTPIGQQTEQMNAFFARPFDGLILYGELMICPEIAALLDSRPQLPFVTFNSPGDPRRPFHGAVRLDGRSAGRLACQMLQLLTGDRRPLMIQVPEAVGPLYRESVEAFREQAALSGQTVAAVGEMFNQWDAAYDLTARWIRDYPDGFGVYVASYNTVPVCQCVEDAGMTKRVAIVGNDIYRRAADKMEKGVLGAILFQNPQSQGRLAVQKLCRFLISGEPLDDTLLLPQLVLSANLPDYTQRFMKY